MIKKKSDQIQVQGNNLGKFPNLNPLLELGQAPRVQIMGLFRVMLATGSGFYSNAGQKSAFGRFLSKWVYNFWPAKNLCTYKDIFHSNIP